MWYWFLFIYVVSGYVCVILCGFIYGFRGKMKGNMFLKNLYFYWEDRIGIYIYIRIVVEVVGIKVEVDIWFKDNRLFFR